MPEAPYVAQQVDAPTEFRRGRPAQVSPVAHLWTASASATSAPISSAAPSRSHAACTSACHAPKLAGAATAFTTLATQTHVRFARASRRALSRSAATACRTADARARPLDRRKMSTHGLIPTCFDESTGSHHGSVKPWSAKRRARPSGGPLHSGHPKHMHWRFCFRRYRPSSYYIKLGTQEPGTSHRLSET